MLATVGVPSNEEQRIADRALCPVVVSQILALKVHDVAQKMREHGVLLPLTTKDAKSYAQMHSAPPQWLVELQVTQTERRSHQVYRNEQQQVETVHKELLLRSQVEQQLLRGAHHIRTADAERIACDIVFRSMKELVRAQGNVSALLGLERAALRWAKGDPADQRTWLLLGGSGV